MVITDEPKFVLNAASAASFVELPSTISQPPSTASSTPIQIARSRVFASKEPTPPTRKP